MKLSDRQTQAALIENDPRWTSVSARDAQADGRFFYAVSTTGVYCRPSCAARLARPENMCFYNTAADAELAGFRPCKRCKPDHISAADNNLAIVTQACRLLETSESIPSLELLAAEVGLSKHYFHRMFKNLTGVTPKAYAVAHRAEKLRAQLLKGSRVSDAIYAAGYNANSRFYNESDRVLGMTASSFRRGGAATEIRFAVGESFLGAILVAQSERGICAILMGDEPDKLVRDLQDRFPKAIIIAGDNDFEKLIAQVVVFVEQPERGLDLPLDIRGTAFQQRVWQVLQEIPVGTTLSYTEVANRINAPKACRAVALACAANSLAVAIPCHRVVRNDGGLSGYRWGIERKKTLLDTEAKQAAQSKNPTTNKKTKQ